MRNPLVRSSIAVALCLSCLWLLAGPVWAQQEPEAAPPPPPPLVTIDGKPITPSDFENYVAQMHSSELLLWMVGVRLVWQEAKRQGVKVTTEELERAIIVDKSDYGAEADFRAALNEGGLDYATYRRRKHLDVVLRKLREKEASVPESELRSYYEAHKDEFTVVPKAHVHQIVLGSVDAAYAAAERVKGAEDFGSVAREVSIDEATKDEGGDRGWITAEDAANEVLWDRMLQVELNEVSAPVEADGRFYLLRVTERVDGGLQPYDAVTAQIRKKLLPDWMRSEGAYVRMLMRQAKISVQTPRYSWLSRVIEDAKHVRLYVGGERLRAYPQRLEDGALLVPARPVLTALQADMKWDADTRMLTATRGTRSLELTVGETSARINGQVGAIARPARMVGGKLYVPPRLVTRALGGSVKYDPREYRLDIEPEAEEEQNK